MPGTERSERARHRVGVPTNRTDIERHTSCVSGLIALLSSLLAMFSPPHGQPVPIAVGPRYQLPPASAHALRGLACTARTTTPIAHVELFVHRRAVLLPAGIGIAPPRRIANGIVTGGRCTYPLSTRDPTGVVYGEPGSRATLADVFRIWGQPLGGRGLLGFTSRRPLRAFVDGVRWHGPPGRIPLGRRNEVVVELGAPVPPHSFYLFPETR